MPRQKRPVPDPNRIKPLEEEAKEFVEQKRGPLKATPKGYSARQLFAAAALSGLLSRSQGPVRMDEIRREAYEWADYMLEIEGP